jgi:hypothetical protein
VYELGEFDEKHSFDHCSIENIVCLIRFLKSVNHSLILLQ